MPRRPLSAYSDSPVGRALREITERDGTSVRQWAISHGYQPHTVYAVLRQWSARPDQTPHGGLARSIMADVLAYIGHPIPGIAPDADPEPALAA